MLVCGGLKLGDFCWGVFLEGEGEGEGLGLQAVTFWRRPRLGGGWIAGNKVFCCGFVRSCFNLMGFIEIRIIVYNCAFRL